jgi:tetratricopeptide (TPR) repeat protein
LFFEQLVDAMTYHLGADHQQIELLEMLFPDGPDEGPHLERVEVQSGVLNSLGVAYMSAGQPKRAAILFHNSIFLDVEEGDERGMSVTLCNRADALRLSGSLHHAEYDARLAFAIGRSVWELFAGVVGWGLSREGTSLRFIGLASATRGAAIESFVALQRANRIFIQENATQEVGIGIASLVQVHLWLNNPVLASAEADLAWQLANATGVERDSIRAARLQGAAALGLGDFAAADERLHFALTRARAVNFVEEELTALVALAELCRQQGDLNAAREYLDDVWEFTERGPYPLFYADALNVLAQIERDAGNHEAAIKAATEAFCKAWCDGPPFAYHWGLEKARAHLRELGAPEPDMPPFDESKYEPMPDVEIDPPDEFHDSTGE